MTSKELLKEIDSWLSFNTEPSKEETTKLRKSIKDHLTEQSNIHGVGDSFISKFEEIIYGGLSDSEIVNALHKLDNDRLTQK